MRILFTGIVLLLTTAIAAQEVEVDKNTGLVKVDGKEAFYLIKKNKSGLTYDLSLQNLEKQELANFTTKDVESLPPMERKGRPGTFLLVTFTETANTARLFPEAFSGVKFIAKQVVNANLIKNQRIDPKAERAFVVSHEGTIFREPETITINVNTNNAPVSKTAAITIKENSIYNHDELIGSFKQVVKDGITTVNVYDKSDTKIAVATHSEGDINADWNVSVLSDNKTYQFLYSPANTLEKLFRFLSEKGLF